MKSNTRKLRSAASVAVLMLLGSVVTTAALASQAGDAKALYLKEMAACRDAGASQPLRTCVTEAKAAYAQNRLGALADHDPVYRQNALKRCDVHKGADRIACRAMIEGQGIVSGSVAAGGTSRELTTVVVPPSPAASR